MRILKNALWLASTRTTGDVASFLLFTVISRIFGPAGTGEYSYAFALANLLGQVSAAGYEDYGVRAYVCAAGAERAHVWHRMLSTTLLQIAVAMVVLCGLLLGGAQRFAAPAVVIELTVYFVSYCLSRVLFVPSMAQQHMKGPALIDCAFRTLAVLSALALILGLHAPLPIALLGFPVAGLTLAYCAFVTGRRHAGSVHWRSSRSELLHTLRQVAPFAATELLYLFYARADVLLIGVWLGAAGTGLYALDVKFVEVGLLPVVLLGNAAYPALGRMAAQRSPHLARSARDLIMAGFLLTGWLVVGIAAVLPLVVIPLFRARFAAAVPLLVWFAALALAKGMETTLCRVMYSVGRQATYVRNLGAGTLVIIVLNVVLIPRFGLEGAVWAAIASTTGVGLACVVALRSHVRTLDIAIAAGRTVLALALTAAALAFAEWQGLSGWHRAALAALLVGLAPDTRRGSLFGHTHPDVT